MKLKKLIKNSNKTISELARETGISRQTFYNLGKHETKLIIVKKICKALNVNYKDYI